MMLGAKEIPVLCPGSAQIVWNIERIQYLKNSSQISSPKVIYHILTNVLRDLKLKWNDIIVTISYHIINENNNNDSISNNNNDSEIFEKAACIMN